MLWKLEYSDYRIEPDLVHGKENAFNKAFGTLMAYPYLSVDLYKFSGDKKIYVGTYEIETKYGKAQKLVEKSKELVEEEKSKERVDEYHRFQVCLSAIGKSEEEVREIIRLPDGNVYRHEINAVLIKLFSTSKAFNRGVDDVLFGNETKCPYGKLSHYHENNDWHTGVESTQLAIKLHGREAVIDTL